MADPSPDHPMIQIPAWLWLVLSALISFVITSGTSLMAAASSLTPGTELTTLSLVVIIAGGVIQAAKDVRTFIAPSITGRAASIALVGLLSGWLAVGCAGSTPRQTYERHKALVQVAVQLGVAGVLREHRDWAAPLTQAVQGARQALTTEEVDLTTLVRFVAARLDLQRLTPEDQVLVQALAGAIQAELSALLADRSVLVPIETRALADEVLGWVESVAIVYQVRTRHQLL